MGIVLVTCSPDSIETSAKRRRESAGDLRQPVKQITGSRSHDRATVMNDSKDGTSEEKLFDNLDESGHHHRITSLRRNPAAYCATQMLADGQPA
jgi:hypothetical protein